MCALHRPSQPPITRWCRPTSNSGVDYQQGWTPHYCFYAVDVNKLIEMGLVKRVAFGKDSISEQLVLTEKGKEFEPDWSKAYPSYEDYKKEHESKH